MYTLKPVTERVKKARDKYRNTVPEICIARFRLITEFYKENGQLSGILKRAKNLKNICENMPVLVNDDELIVGAQGTTYRASALYPETGFAWAKETLVDNDISKREIDPYILSEENRQYIAENADFWTKESNSAKADAFVPNALYEHEGNGISAFRTSGCHGAPVGHFCVGHSKAIHVGFGALKAEAEGKIKELESEGIPYNTIENYNFYRGVSIVCDGMITLTKRYAAEVERLAANCKDEKRRHELDMMADTLNRVMEKPCETFWDALQCIYMYITCVALDGCLHGLSIGRLDQYLAEYYYADINAGRITPEFAQELLDMFYLKVAEMNKVIPRIPTEANPGYTSGQLVTLGGVKPDGTDATNEVTYMMLQTAGRLILHSPPQAMRVHKDTPPELWEAAIETTKIAGGVPTLENDEVIVPALMKRGLSLESARNYCLIGCVEPAGCGDEWPACGGDGAESYFNLANALCLAINDGYNKLPDRDGRIHDRRLGVATGYLRDMTSMEELLDAYEKQVDFFVKLHVACTNSFENRAREYMPLPAVSCCIEGCMETGRDVMYGGAKFNSTGMAGVALGNVADSLQMIEHLVFDKKICTAAQLQEVLNNNWVGYESLHDYVVNRAPHYGNGDATSDKYVKRITTFFANCVNSRTGPRGRYSAGMYPVTINIIYGRQTAATPDGRVSGQPLADGISPVQGMDKKGPTALLRSILAFDNQDDYPNGTLLNMKFDPNTVKTEADKNKLVQLISTYFAAGGMEMQINIVDSETMKNAQKSPQEFKDLVVRVAGFSAYFVELAEEGQKDLISRTELGL